ncbi:hypothetical protein HDU76_004443 [Blyttiomyces sp. JEL0837]|nr:hypothetical protein HDU76_004443 [Blyttiomyces sp. JEL0837]
MAIAAATSGIAVIGYIFAFSVLFVLTNKLVSALAMFKDQGIIASYSVWLFVLVGVAAVLSLVATVFMTRAAFLGREKLVDADFDEDLYDRQLNRNSTPVGMATPGERKTEAYTGYEAPSSIDTSSGYGKSSAYNNAASYSSVKNTDKTSSNLKSINSDYDAYYNNNYSNTQKDATSYYNNPAPARSAVTATTAPTVSTGAQNYGSWNAPGYQPATAAATYAQTYGHQVSQNALYAQQSPPQGPVYGSYGSAQYGAQQQQPVSQSQEADEGDFMMRASLLEKIRDIVFSVMFFMVHGNATSVVLEYLGFVVEDLQLLQFFISTEIDQAYFMPHQIVASSLEYQNMELKTYSVWMAISSLAVFVMMFNIAWVAFGVIVLVNAIACNRVNDGDEPEVPYATLANTYCSDLSRIPLAAIASFAMFIYIPTCISLSAVFFDTNPTLKSPSNRVHGRVDIIYLSLKTTLVVIYKFLDQDLYLPKIICALLACLLMLASVLYYFPYYNPTINKLRAGLYCGASSVGLVSAIGAIIFSSTGNQINVAIFVAMCIAFPLGFAAGFYVSGYLLKNIQEHARARIKLILQLPQTDTDFTHPEPLVFAVWTHVEITARFITVFMTERRRRINKNGLPEMKRIFNADFLGFGVRLDVASYAEFQKTDRDAKVNHFLAVQELRNIFPRSRVIMRYFARFCYDVTNDIIRGDSLTERADDLETEESMGVGKPMSKTFQSTIAENETEDDVDSVPDISSTNQHVESMEAKVFGSSRDSEDGAAYGTGSDDLGSEKLAQNTDVLQQDMGQRSERTSKVQANGGRRSNYAPSNPESTASSATEKRAQAVSQQMRARALKTKSISIQALLIISTTIALAIIITNFSAVLNLLSLTSDSLKTLEREFYSAIEFRRLRQLQNAFNEGNIAKFHAIQEKLQEEMLNFTEVSESLYYTRDPEPANNAFYSEPLIPILESFYPGLDGSYETLSSVGLTIASTSFTSFQNSSYDNGVRFVLDNFPVFQPYAYDYSMNALYFGIFQERISDATKKIFILTGMALSLHFRLVERN